MSGTSLDGIDAAEVEVERRDGRIAVDLAHFATTPIGPSLRAAILEACPPNTGSTSCVAELDFAIGEAFADAAQRCMRSWGTDPRSVDVIGSHGQTLYHAPDDGT